MGQRTHEQWSAEEKREALLACKSGPKRIAALERELRRTEAGLAETAALLILSISDLIWGEGKEER